MVKSGCWLLAVLYKKRAFIFKRTSAKSAQDLRYLRETKLSLSNTFFKFKQFTIHQTGAAMKVTTDACLFGAWAAADMQRTQPVRMLDIGTGTGLLSLMTAQVCPAARIDAVEIEPGAAQQAAENFSSSPWADRIRMQQADIREAAFTEPFDVIICNPPFYENELASPDARRNLAHHAGGLLLTELLPLIAKWLSHDGHAYLLLPAKRADEIPALLNSSGLKAEQYCRVRQSPKHDPFRIMLRCGHVKANDQPNEETEIIIEQTPGRYTDAFTRLLKDYYLNL